MLDKLVLAHDPPEGAEPRKGQILAAITALKQICNHPSAYQDDEGPLAGRSGKLARLEEIVESVFAAGERLLVFTHFAEWGQKLANHLSARTGTPVACYHGGLSRTTRDRLVHEFQTGEGPGALVLSLKAGGTGLNLTAANHVVLYDRWWNPAVEDQARDRAWRIGQTHTVICHRLVCPGTVDERVEEVVAGKRRIADLVLPKSSSLADLDSEQLRAALGHQSRHRLGGERPRIGGPGGMSPTRRRKPVSRRTQRNRSVPARDFWGASVGEDTPLPVIRPSDHPTALVHSLGAPPFPGGAVATHYFDAVYERAAALASRSRPPPISSRWPTTKRPTSRFRRPPDDRLRRPGTVHAEGHEPAVGRNLIDRGRERAAALRVCFNAVSARDPCDPRSDARALRLRRRLPDPVARPRSRRGRSLSVSRARGREGR